MDKWPPEESDFNPLEPGENEAPVAFVATQDPVMVKVKKVPDDRTPEGMVCMGTFLNPTDHIIARSAIPPDVFLDLEEKDIFHGPVRLALAAVEQDPGLQCRLFALIPAQKFQDPDDTEDDEGVYEEPWAQSVPQFQPETEAEDQTIPENAVVPFLLGHIVRFRKDRKHPEDLAMEAGDVLRSLLADRPSTTEVIDKLLDDLLEG
ncbi:MAG: hypothetical protein OEZ54_07180 [Gemmatimonadota bacterium]|nr:hypothetical protein [Gemmatimonadota bacterium]